MKKANFVLGSLVTFFVVYGVLAMAQITGQYASPGVHTLQVTIGAATTQITTADIPCKQVTFQNNAAGSMRIGDSSTTSSRGMLLAAGTPGSSLTVGPFSTNTACNLNQFYVNGTSTQVVDVIYFQ